MENNRNFSVVKSIMKIYRPGIRTPFAAVGIKHANHYTYAHTIKKICAWALNQGNTASKVDRKIEVSYLEADNRQVPKDLFLRNIDSHQ